MILTINATNDDAQKIRVELGEQNCVVELTRLFYGKGWFFSLYKDEELITSMRRIDSGLPIIGSNTLDFVGNFQAYPITDNEQSIGDEPWGKTHELVWYDDSV